MNVGTFDRKMAIRLGVGLAAILLLKFVVFSDRTPAVVAAVEDVPAAEARLKRVREIAATVPGLEERAKQATAELAVREKGILQADTAAQAHAMIQDLLHRVGLANGIDIRGFEDQRIRPLGSDYGEASVSVRFSCSIEQLVNFLAALDQEQQLFSTQEINVTGTTDAKKIIQVRLTVAGAVTKKVATEKRPGGAL
ncbi:MAG TPA: GspMb/PilO family protein [Candidatus Solibacter sp.]|nr:GspMb/PilO family protein [Candidatus Solibacter sp.]